MDTTFADLATISSNASWADAARRQIGRLRELHASIEDAFLAIGDSLRRADGTARNLSIMANALVTRLAEDEFQQTLHGLDGALHMVDELRRRKNTSGDSLARIGTATTDIRNMIGGLGGVMARVNVLGVNAKIEAAQMSAAGVDFSLFTHEIVRLAARGREVLAGALDQLNALGGAAGAAEAEQRDFERRHLHDLETVGQRLSQSIGAMRQREREAVRALHELPRLLADATSRIGAIVNGLQFGDITRQRLEHVEEALEVMVQVLASEQTTHELEIENIEVDLFVAAMCSLQAEQLKALGSDFVDKVRGVLEGLEQLVGIIDAIKVDTEAVYSAGADGGSTFLMEIDHDLERVSAVIAEYRAATLRTERRLAAVTEAGRSMTEAMRQIRDIDADMNVLGLNASIKCGNLGSRGRALNVVAQELRAYARQTRAFTTSVSERLDGVIALAEGLAQGRGAAGGGDDMDALKASVDQWVETLRQSGGETAWVLDQVREQGISVVTVAREAIAAFDVHSRVQRTVAETVEALDRIARAAAPGLTPQAMEDARRRMLFFMESHYTMASERIVHGGQAAAAPAGGAADDLSDILF